MCFPGGVGVVKLAVCIVITVTQRYRVSYMNVYALLNFLNELRKGMKCSACNLSPFRDELIEFRKCRCANVRSSLSL